ncbi:MAG: hypothetical protein E2O82_03655 [Betaproteobacteria bacterium]|nr:MAG: hypothetical protein E2O82_03655 [Betaproteobacteria bacterium]
MSKALVNQNYISGQDGSVSFESPVVELSTPTSSLSYQIKWESGVIGVFSWKASIFDPKVWEDAISCDEKIELDTAQVSGQSSIIVIPDYWRQVEYLKFVFTPSEGSAGTIDCVIRIVPI